MQLPGSNGLIITINNLIKQGKTTPHTPNQKREKEAIKVKVSWILLTFVHLKCFCWNRWGSFFKEKAHWSSPRMNSSLEDWAFLFGRNLVFLRSQRWKMPLEHYIFAILILGKTMRHTSSLTQLQNVWRLFSGRRLLGRDWKEKFEEMWFTNLERFLINKACNLKCCFLLFVPPYHLILCQDLRIPWKWNTKLR